MVVGPRARRRLAATAIGLGAVAVIGVLAVLHHPSGSGTAPAASTTASHGLVAVTTLFPITDRISFGMTKQQVRARVGRPAKTLVDVDAMQCWQYPVNRTYYPANGKKKTLDAVRACFAFGQYQVAYFEWNGKWDY